MHDKYKSCSGCPDRTIYTDDDEHVNCHMTCEGYLHRQQQNEELKQAKAADKEYNNFHQRTLWKFKRINYNRKKGK